VAVNERTHYLALLSPHSCQQRADKIKREIDRILGKDISDKPARKRRKMSVADRQKISAARKKWWAERKKQQKQGGCHP